MKILFIANYHQLYGANRSMLSVIEEFVRQGDDVTVLLPKSGDFSEKLNSLGINNIIIPYYSQILYYKLAWPYLSLPLLVLFTILILPYIIFKIKKLNPDLIYSNTSAENLGLIISKVLNIRHLYHIREFMDLDYKRYFIGGRKLKKKYISKSDIVIYVSHSVASHVLMGSSMPIGHKVIYNGVSFRNNKFCCRYLGDTINFGIVGLLVEGKGQDVAISYFNLIKDFYPNSLLHIWGDREGMFKRKIIKLVSDLKLNNRVVFHGFVKDTSLIYKDMNVLLMCSQFEGFGRVTIEAMANSIPVIGYNSGGTSELVKNGYNGYLFSDEDQFVYSVNTLFSSVFHYQCLCKNSFDYAYSNFSESIYTKNVYDFVKSQFYLCL